MAKLTLPTLTSSFGSVDLLNEAFRTIEALAELALLRDGTAPNQMNADLDLNGYSLLNLGESSDGYVTDAELDDALAAASSGIVVQRQQAFTATAAQTVFTLTTTEYTPGASNLAVYVNGVRKFVTLDFTETSSTVFTLLTPLAGGEKVVAATNEYLGTVTPSSVSVLWADLLNIPVTASRNPTYDEVANKPMSFNPSSHVHSTSDITSGAGLADARRGVYVQAGTPTASRIGELWFY